MQAPSAPTPVYADPGMSELARVAWVAGCDDGTEISIGPRFADILVWKDDAVLIRLLPLVDTPSDTDIEAAIQASLVSRL